MVRKCLKGICIALLIAVIAAYLILLYLRATRDGQDNTYQGARLITIWKDDCI